MSEHFTSGDSYLYGKSDHYQHGIDDDGGTHTLSSSGMSQSAINSVKLNASSAK